MTNTAIDIAYRLRDVADGIEDMRLPPRGELVTILRDAADRLGRDGRREPTRHRLTFPVIAK